jgi:hypothetical protein
VRRRWVCHSGQAPDINSAYRRLTLDGDIQKINKEAAKIYRYIELIQSICLAFLGGSPKLGPFKFALAFLSVPTLKLTLTGRGIDRAHTALVLVPRKCDGGVGEGMEGNESRGRPCHVLPPSRLLDPTINGRFADGTDGSMFAGVTDGIFNSQASRFA